MLSPGLCVVFLYLTMTYGLPWVYNTLFELQPISSYRIFQVQGWAILFVLAFAMVLLILDKKMDPRRTMAQLPPFRHFEKWRLFFALVALLVGVKGNADDLNGFRTSHESAFTGGFSLVYLFALVPLFLKIDLFYHGFFIREPEAGKVNFFARWFIFTAAFLSVNGTANGLVTMVYFCYAVSPKIFTGFLQKRPWKGTPRRTLLLAAPFVAVMIIFGGWVTGEAAKRKGDASSAVEEALSCHSNECAKWAMERVSSSYYSLLRALHEDLFSADIKKLSLLTIPIYTMGYRIDAIFGSPLQIAKPEIASISRLNYTSLALDPRGREGTSPGLIAIFLMSFPFPVNLVVLIAYTVFIIKMVNSLIRGIGANPNLAGLALMLWLMMIFFESPVDLLVGLDDGTIFVLLFVLLHLQTRDSTKDRRFFRPLGSAIRSTP